MGFPGTGTRDKNGREQRLIRPAEVVATGLAAAAGAFLTSRFGIAGTVLGTAVTVMVITAASSVIQAYLEGAAGRLLSLPASRRRSILLGGLASATLSLLVGLVAVTGVELGAGKTLSCWLWDRCPAVREEPGSGAASTTRASLLGGEPGGSAVPARSTEPQPVRGVVLSPAPEPATAAQPQATTPEPAAARVPDQRLPVPEVRPAAPGDGVRVSVTEREPAVPEVQEVRVSGEPPVAAPGPPAYGAERTTPRAG